MSYYGTCADVKATIAAIEESENTHSNTGSPILHGSSMPGGAANGKAPSGATMMPKRTKMHTRTDTLTRKYAATGSSKS